MPRRSRWSERLPLGDDGSASLEFLVAGLLLLVPVVYLVVTLGMIQHGALGVEAAARHTARAVSLATSSADAEQRARLVQADVAAEYGLDPATVRVALVCPEAPRSCPEAGAVFAVTVSAVVPLPLVPPVFGLDELAVVPVEATAVQKASRLWGS